MHRPVQFAVQIGVAVAALALITRTWLVEGLVDPLIVSGGSIAPALRGAHRRVTCSDCGFAFACGEESLPSEMLAKCPNCGAKSDLESLPVQPGDRLIVDRTAYVLNRPQRWDIAVLQTPDDPQTLCVKRVVGLPGEAVEIRDGDIYIDGQPERRSLRQLLAMAIPVHDANCRPTNGASTRWHGERTDSGWRQLAAGFEHSASQDPADAVHDYAEQADAEHFGRDDGVDWLIYEHVQTISDDSSAHRVGPILDDLAYNQNESRELVAVHDVILQCRVSAGESGKLWLMADDGRKKFEASLDAATGQGELSSGNDRLEQFSFDRHVLNRPAEIVLALVDAGLRLTLGGDLLIDYCYDPAGLECQPGPRPLAVGSAGAQLSVADLKVLRDVHYLASHRGAAVTSRRLGTDEYWLLGDNSSQSVDSRSWPPARANLFIGKALIHRTGR